MRRAAVPVLTYHAMNIAGNGYGNNDHVALAHDLEILHALGVRVVPLAQVARAVVEERLPTLQGCVALSLDDGADFDVRDVPHPVWGPQRGILGILRDFRAAHGAAAQPGLHATSFVIVSPQARAVLDRHHMVGCGWWSDDWWQEADSCGLMAVESHSWDHNQSTLEQTATSAPRGAFALATREDAHAEVAQATRYLRDRRGRGGDVLFAYPYGPANDFLARDYLPDPCAGHGVYAAFTTDGVPVEPGLSRWRLPRYVCGWHWKSPGELESLMVSCGVVRRRRGLLGRSARKPGGRRAGVAPPESAAQSWRDCVRAWEVNDARAVAGELFRASFPGGEIPDRPRHFVLVYSPAPGAAEGAPRVVAYMHHTPHDGVHLSGGQCADADACGTMPKWLSDQVQEQGGLHAIVARESIAMLGESPAAFGYAALPPARSEYLRAGFVDTGRPKLMVRWRKPLTEAQRQDLIERVEAAGPF